MRVSVDGNKDRYTECESKHVNDYACYRGRNKDPAGFFKPLGFHFLILNYRNKNIKFIYCLLIFPVLQDVSGMLSFPVPRLYR